MPDPVFVPPPESCSDHLPWQQVEQSLRARFTVIPLRVTAAGDTFDLIKPRSADDLLSEEDFDRYQRLPYWAEAWPSSKVLAERIAATPAKGRLLELGCGLGWVSLLAIRRGYEVTATDYYAEALEFVRVNAHRNNTTPPRTRLVDWRRYPNDLQPFDCVVGSDVLYEKGNSDLVARAFAVSLAADGQGWVTDPGRAHAASFPDACAAQGLIAEKIDRVIATVDTLTQTVDLYSVRRR